MKKFILIVLITVSSGVSLFVNAVPVDPTPKQVTMPNGKSITITEMGDDNKAGYR